MKICTSTSGALARGGYFQRIAAEDGHCFGVSRIKPGNGLVTQGFVLWVGYLPGVGPRKPEILRRYVAWGYCDDMLVGGEGSAVVEGLGYGAVYVF